MTFAAMEKAKTEVRTMYKALADSTLHSMTKKEIIELLRIAEHNAKASQEQVEQQAENLKDWVPVVHGRWISFLDGDHIMPERYYRCSRCGRVESRRQPYCHCGAKMDGGADNG